MKYKIGNVEVEAIQVKRANRCEISSFLRSYFVSIQKNDAYSDIDLKIEIRTHNAILKPNFTDWLIITGDSLACLSEQDFNNMATKVKEPKFKVGDKAYYLDVDDAKFDCNALTVQSVEFNTLEEIFVYHFDHDTYDFAYQPDLFTLEEAIEKLKDL